MKIVPKRTNYNNEESMLSAYKSAKETFKNFWYCISQDFNRIVPAVGMAIVKVGFCDKPNGVVEHMWIDEIEYDGVSITGVLMNQPNELQEYEEGDQIKISIDQVEDWLCVEDEEVFGGYTIQILRNAMSTSERRDHDNAWGLKFPKPNVVNIPKQSVEFETNTIKLFEKSLRENPSALQKDLGEGKTILHYSALFGRSLMVKYLLSVNAD